MRTALEICEEIAEQESIKQVAETVQAELEAELFNLTGKEYLDFLAGMAKLLEPVDGYPPGSTGSRHLANAQRDVVQNRTF
jgi:hypothetical protein